MGSMHPILFFVFVYVVALLFSIFICSSLFYSCNASPANGLTEQPGSARMQVPLHCRNKGIPGTKFLL
jgi:hypothetical protein